MTQLQRGPRLPVDLVCVAPLPPAAVGSSGVTQTDAVETLAQKIELAQGLLSDEDGHLETRLLQQYVPIERVRTLVETTVQPFREQLAGHSRWDAENTRWDAESPRRDPDNSQSTALHLDAAARKLETRVLE